MQHLLYAPGRYTGYEAKTLPGVREAIEERRYSEAEAQIDLLSHALAETAACIEQLAIELDSTATPSGSGPPKP
jgi:N-acetylated-alpha-linked acidic dipeptidase